MIAQGEGGSIIFTSSTSSRVAGWGNACYGASKGGVDQLVRQLAQEWGRYGIRVNAINPGYTEHEMADAAGAHDAPGVAEYIERFIPLGRRGRIDEMGGPGGFPRERRRELHHRPLPLRRWRTGRGLKGRKPFRSGTADGPAQAWLCWRAPKEISQLSFEKPSTMSSVSSMSFATAGRAAMTSNQRLTLGKLSMSWRWR